MTRRGLAVSLALGMALACAACGGGAPAAPTPPAEKPTWAWASASTGDCWSVGVAACPDGGMIVVGGFNGTGVLGASTGKPSELPGEDASDIFLARVTPDGELQWARSITGLGWTEASDVDVAADGSIYVCGYFFDTATFAGGEPQEVNFASLDGEDGFVACYEADGRLRWARQIASADIDEMHGVAALPDGGVVAVGLFSAALTLGAGSPAEVTLEPGSIMEALTACFGADGTLRWARASTSLGYAGAWDATTLADGSVAVCGDYTGATSLGDDAAGLASVGGTSDVFVACYATDGSLRWLRSEGGTDNDYAAQVAGGPDGSVRLTGMFAGQATFGAEGPAPRTLTAAGRHDGFLAAYDPGGALIWVTQVAGGEHDAALQPRVLDDGSTLLLASFTGAALLGEGETREALLLGDEALDVEVALARYGVDGRLHGAAALGGPGVDYAVGMVPMSDGTLVLVGSFTDRLLVGGEPLLLGETTKACAFLARIEPPAAPE